MPAFTLSGLQPVTWEPGNEGHTGVWWAITSPPPKLQFGHGSADFNSHIYFSSVLFLRVLNFVAVLDLQKNYKDSAESPYTRHTQFPIINLGPWSQIRNRY